MTMSDEILRAYLNVTQHASRQFRLHFGKLNLTFPQALVLNCLLEESPVPISALAARTGSANSTISGIVDRLEKIGLVQRERSREDRRIIYVGLTEEYCARRDDASANVHSYFASLMDTLDKEEQEIIRNGLLKLDEVLSRSEEEQA